MKRKKKVAILISGKGSNMRALIEDMKNADHPGEATLIISDKKNAEGIVYAKQHNLKTRIIDQNIGSQSDFENQLAVLIKENKIDLICLAGFMKILSGKFLKDFEQIIINIHPSILPLFKGLQTHKRALNSGMALHGATVHEVTSDVDEGRILGQAIVPILSTDTEETLRHRVLQVEHKLYPIVLRRVLAGKTGDPVLLVD